MEKVISNQIDQFLDQIFISGNRNGMSGHGLYFPHNMDPGLDASCSGMWKIYTIDLPTSSSSSSSYLILIFFFFSENSKNLVL